MLRLASVIASLLLAVASSRAADWVRAGLNTNQPIWGVRGGLLWAVPPGGFHSHTGPRGLIRLGYPTLTNGAYDLINFIAVEPVVRGHRGFSELEQSQLDHKQGKRLWAVAKSETNDTVAPEGLVAGDLFQPKPGVEQLDVVVRVERFENGAQVRLLVAQRSDAPDEISLTIHADPESAPLDYCILTATMGNKARTRLLWLKDEVVSSKKLYPTLEGEGFAPHRSYGLDHLTRAAQGDVVVAVTSDESNPSGVFPFPGTKIWYYGGIPITQYWKKNRGAFRNDLEAVVNARRTYWLTRQPIPGGVAFENFEMTERFYQGQQFTFGITGKTPAQLGIKRQR